MCYTVCAVKKTDCLCIRNTEKNKKRKKKFVRLKKKRHIKGGRKNSPLAQWLERAPYKSTIKVQFFYGLPLLIKNVCH